MSPGSMSPVLLCIDTKSRIVRRYMRQKTWYTKLVKVDEVQIAEVQMPGIEGDLEAFRCGSIISAKLAAEEEPNNFPVPA